MATPTIFISYSSKDRGWVKDYLLVNLEQHGLSCHIDYRDFEIGTPCIMNMERAIEKCRKTILVFSPNWVESEFTGFESMMLQTESPLNKEGKVLPLMLEKCTLPRRLSIFTYADFTEEDERDFQLQRVIDRIKKDFALLKSEKPEYPPLDEQHCDIVHLPNTGFELFGRQKELKILNDAWESEGTNILTFVAYGGVGKSTLINKWLEKMRWDNYRGAAKVFAWSFYSQGTNDYVTSSDRFINEALTWFGEKNFARLSAWDKGKRLAQLVREQKTLLILDGLEPLQSDNVFDRGKIKDAALVMLLTELAKHNRGLCLITTREKIPELARYPEKSRQENLDSISDEAGIKLLEMRGVAGSKTELIKAVKTFGNHALAINLLAEYLHQFPGHAVQKARDISDIDILVKKGKYPRRIIQAFAEQFGKDSPEFELLSILGLFDRPVERAAHDAVIQGAPITGLTALLATTKGEAWYRLLERLRRFKLIAEKSEHRPDTLDCHPLIREHFGEKLVQDNADVWKAGHGRLYDYYKNKPEKELPDTLEEMEPLFAAVKHGCLAGRVQEAMVDVYWRRIKRGNEHYSTRTLGAIGADLACVAAFFTSTWDRPANGLMDIWKAELLNWAGFRLRAVGKLQDAVEPMKVGLKIRINEENWLEAARDTGNLSQLQLTQGNLKEALNWAKQSVTFADRSGDDSQIVARRSTLADVFFQVGKAEEAKALFIEAEKRQQKWQPDYPYLYSFRGYLYCDLLITCGSYEVVEERAECTIIIAEQENHLLSIALDKLSLGKVLMLRAIQNGSDIPQPTQQASFSSSQQYLNSAVNGLREAGQLDDLPRGLLARAALYRHTQQFADAWIDLDEAREIAEYGKMRLHLTDYYLEAARNIKAQLTESTTMAGFTSPNLSCKIIENGEEIELCKVQMEKRYQIFIAKAEHLIKETGYHRRDYELTELEG
ncbi:MAG: toll/interleukin-1 receptor domain-containing protein [Desulfuromusa sp.]|nr:toll/interleukin-1 receptor domain-containing protein [Desulfuromusa sp.]